MLAGVNSVGATAFTVVWDGAARGSTAADMDEGVPLVELLDPGTGCGFDDVEIPRRVVDTTLWVQVEAEPGKPPHNYVLRVDLPFHLSEGSILNIPPIAHVKLDAAPKGDDEVQANVGGVELEVVQVIDQPEVGPDAWGVQLDYMNSTDPEWLEADLASLLAYGFRREL